MVDFTPTELKLLNAIMENYSAGDSIHIDKLTTIANKEAGISFNWCDKAIKGLHNKGVLKSSNDFRFILQIPKSNSPNKVGKKGGNSPKGVGEKDMVLRSDYTQQGRGIKDNNTDNNINNLISPNTILGINTLKQFTQAVSLITKGPAHIVFIIHVHGFTYKQELLKSGLYDKSITRAILKLKSLELIQTCNSPNPLVEKHFNTRKTSPGVKPKDILVFNPDFKNNSSFFDFCIKIIQETTLDHDWINQIKNYNRLTEGYKIKDTKKLEFAINALKRRINDPEYSRFLTQHSKQSGYSVEEIEKAIKGGN
ncbi:hypothetical protein GOV13_03400 [Candidatus Pacearchaeota archaeon]|nr:hypothetical protein [Candidatus Pacearchaeota archaeon]